MYANIHSILGGVYVYIYVILSLNTPSIKLFEMLAGVYEQNKFYNNVVSFFCL